MIQDYTKELNELNQLDNSLETNSNEEKISSSDRSDPVCLACIHRLHTDPCCGKQCRGPHESHGRRTQDHQALIVPVHAASPARAGIWHAMCPRDIWA